MGGGAGRECQASWRHARVSRVKQREPQNWCEAEKGLQEAVLKPQRIAMGLAAKQVN